jgi:hypothetical protein
MYLLLPNCLKHLYNPYNTLNATKIGIAKQWRSDRKLFNSLMKKETFDTFLDMSNSEGKGLANALEERMNLEGTETPFAPEIVIKTCFLRILVESRECIY